MSSGSLNLTQSSLLSLAVVESSHLHSGHMYLNTKLTKRLLCSLSVCVSFLMRMVITTLFLTGSC